jgi:hypothetical protein
MPDTQYLVTSSTFDNNGNKGRLFFGVNFGQPVPINQTSFNYEKCRMIPVRKITDLGEVQN